MKEESENLSHSHSQEFSFEEKNIRILHSSSKSKSKELSERTAEGQRSKDESVDGQHVIVAMDATFDHAQPIKVVEEEADN
jgi:hypothetical protein